MARYIEEKAVDDGRSIIFDILAIDKDGNKINVEMEKNAAVTMKRRTQFYWAKAFTRGFEKKSKFKDLKETICINILGTNIFKDDIICREYVLYDIENKDRLDECLSIHFVELQKAVEKVKSISEVDYIQFKVIQEALEESKILDWKDDGSWALLNPSTVTNIILFDTIPTGLTFVPGSVLINNVSFGGNIFI